MTKPGKGVARAEQRCPWCSTAAPKDAERCPACGAALREAGPAAAEDIPGLTQVDPVLGMRRQLPRPNRLVGWLADIDTEPASTADLAAGRRAGAAEVFAGADPASVAPPSDEVRREMRRLELEAIRAELEERTAEARQADLEAPEAPAVHEAAADGSSGADTEGHQGDTGGPAPG